MKIKKVFLWFLLAFLGIQNPLLAKLVDIPDANFRAKLKTLYPSCFVNDQMETTCNAVTSATFLDVSNLNIVDLSGIEYFVNLQDYLSCSNNQLKTLPSLPNNLKALSCHNNQLKTLPNLPNSLVDLNCGENQLTSLPTLPNSLKYLNCRFNQITSLPTLPSSLLDLYCQVNLLTNIPALPSSPNSLINLACLNNLLDFADLEALNFKPNINNYNATPQSYIIPIPNPLPNIGGTINLDGTIGGSANQYQWYKDNVAIAGATNPIFTKNNITVSDAGKYKCKVISSLNSPLVQGVTITSNEIFVLDPLTATETFIDKNFFLFPNPTEGNFELQINQNKTAVEISILNTSGQVVFQKKYIDISEKIKFDISHFPAGLYVVQCNYGKEVFTKKIVKK